MNIISNMVFQSWCKQCPPCKQPTSVGNPHLVCSMDLFCFNSLTIKYYRFLVRRSEKLKNKKKLKLLRLGATASDNRASHSRTGNLPSITEPGNNVLQQVISQVIIQKIRKIFKSLPFVFISHDNRVGPSPDSCGGPGISNNCHDCQKYVNCHIYVNCHNCHC